ncbi:MAG: sodium:solute symporter family protein [Bacteroidales bacterium]|nr:sodium:solute symporter family protein [Bacteroidales bacterium]
MTTWFIIFAAIYVGLLVFASIKSYSRHRTADEFMLANKSITSILGFLTYSAALFSAFTFMGMPDFFRNHGVGAWIFLAVSDAVMVFLILWFGYKLRRQATRFGFKGIAGLMMSCFRNKWAGYALFTSAFIFLIPYVAIQIRGISIFLDATVPGSLPAWGWSAIIVTFMLIYSEIGGLKAIVYSDAIQGLILLTVIWLIGTTCIGYEGGVASLFNGVEEVNSKLLSTPGPNGLFDRQFLITSLIAVVLIPVTQPHFTIRIAVMKSLRSMHRMAIGVGVFALLIILPTAFIGMYGAINYTDATTSNFLSNALLFDQADTVAALAIIGLFAAVLSTTNAQLFALGSELRSILKGKENKVMMWARIGIFIFAVITLIFSTYMSDQLVLLARMSFTGTSMMAPVVIVGVLAKEAPGKELFIVSLTALFVFLASLFDLVPAEIHGFLIESILYIVLVITTALSLIIRKTKLQKSL